MLTGLSSFATMPHRVLSRSVEDYLKAIFGLSSAGNPAYTSAIADALDIQPASVTGMVKRLAEAGLVGHVPYRGVSLTEAGERAALKVLRRHRVIETYLCELLEYEWDDVHAEAERLEHSASDELVERMATALGFPSHDPHGSPIPTRAGEIEATELATLADAERGTRVRIRQVRGHEANELRSMAADGLVPGVAVLVDSTQDVDGVVGVIVGGDEGVALAVQDHLARRIFVVPDEA
jgi:DtxR family Mn-dependent transcriptional regulator